MTLSFDRLVPPQARCRWARIRAQDASGAKGRSLYCQPRRKPDANPDATPHVDLGEAHGKGGAGVLAAVASIVLGHAADAADAAGASRGNEQIPIAKATVTQIDVEEVQLATQPCPPLTHTVKSSCKQQRPCAGEADIVSFPRGAATCSAGLAK